MREWLGNGRRGVGFYALIALCAGLVVLLLGISALGVARGNPAEEASSPTVTPTPEPVGEGPGADEAQAEEVKEAVTGKQAAEKRAAGEEAEKQAVEKEAEKVTAQEADAEPAPVPAAATASASAPASAPATEPNPAPASASASASAPADTTMYLTVPKMGIYDVPVVDGTTEASLDEGAGHLLGSGYP